MTLDLYVRVMNGDNYTGTLSGEREWPTEWRLPVAGDEIQLSPSITLRVKCVTFLPNSLGVAVDFEEVQSYLGGKLQSRGWVPTSF